jgi:oligopeptidase B
MSDQPASAPTKTTSRTGEGSGQYPEPPAAKRVPTERTHHGDTVTDQYAWLTDKANPETIAFLEAENAYTEEVTVGQQELREAIFGEIKARTKETDLTVPFRKGG